VTILEHRAAGELALPQPLPDQIQRLTMEWLLSFRSAATRRAYRVHLSQWLAFAAGVGIDPLVASRGDGNLWARWLEAPPQNNKPATIAAKLAAATSWYTYLSNENAVPRSRFTSTDRPKLNRSHSEAVGLTQSEARMMVTAADADYGRGALRTSALIRLMLSIELRVSEIPELQVSSLGFRDGLRTLRIGDRVHSLPSATSTAMDRYLESRAQPAGITAPELEGFLFTTATGQPVGRRYLFDLVQRIAREAGLEQPERVTPNSLRHTLAALADEVSAPMTHLRDALGHGTPAASGLYLQRSETIVYGLEDRADVSAGQKCP
jgi:integrase/recombinase XerD